MNTTFLDKKDYIKRYKDQTRDDRKKHWKKFLYLTLTLFLVGFGTTLGSSLLLGETILIDIFIQLISFFATLFSVKFILNVIDNKTLDYKEILKSFTLKQLGFGFLSYVATIILINLGLILLIVPGLIVSFMLMLVTPIISEKTINPITALKESRRLTDGYKIKMFNTMFSVGLHYFVIPILITLASLVAVHLGVSFWILVALNIPLWLSLVWANLALITLVPRIYRDLQKIKSSNIVEVPIEVVEA